MYGRYILLIVGIISMLASGAWAQQIRRIGIASFSDISSESQKAEDISTIIQNSLATVLKKEKDFAVILVSNTVSDLTHARAEGTNQKFDAIIYGSYRKENRRFVILIQIYDILENEIKLSRIYQGEYSRSIFDTVDQIAFNSSEEIRKALPAILSEEEVARFSAKRREIYSQQEVAIRREMRLGFGITSSKAYLEFYHQDQSSSLFASGETLSLASVLTLDVRLEWFRFHILQTSLPWFPSWYSMNETDGNETFFGRLPPIQNSNTLSISQTIHERGEFAFDIFWDILPSLSLIIRIGYNSYHEDFCPPSDMNERAEGLMIGVGVANKQGEITLSTTIFPPSQGWRGILPVDIISTKGTKTNMVQFNFPLTTLSFTHWFTPSFGVQGHFFMADTQHLYIYHDTEGRSGSNFAHAIVYETGIELLYRFQVGF